MKDKIQIIEMFFVLVLGALGASPTFFKLNQRLFQSILGYVRGCGDTPIFYVLQHI